MSVFSKLKAKFNRPRSMPMDAESEVLDTSILSVPRTIDEPPEDGRPSTGTVFGKA
jgi:hypothetical protein